MPKLCESAIEEMAIEELQNLGYAYISGVDLAPDALNPERNSYGDVLLIGRLQKAMTKLNPTIPADAIQPTFPGCITMQIWCNADKY